MCLHRHSCANNPYANNSRRNRYSLSQNTYHPIVWLGSPFIFWVVLAQHARRNLIDCKPLWTSTLFTNITQFSASFSSLYLPWDLPAAPSRSLPWRPQNPCHHQDPVHHQNQSATSPTTDNPVKRCRNASSMPAQSSTPQSMAFRHPSQLLRKGAPCPGPASRRAVKSSERHTSPGGRKLSVSWR